MNIDWMHLLWQGRWEALVLIWNGVVTDVEKIWWFGPLMVLVLVVVGRRAIVRLVAYIARVFVHAHSGS